MWNKTFCTVPHSSGITPSRTPRIVTASRPPGRVEIPGSLMAFDSLERCANSSMGALASGTERSAEQSKRGTVGTAAHLKPDVMLQPPGHEGLHQALPQPSPAIPEPACEHHVSHAPDRQLPSGTPSGS